MQEMQTYESKQRSNRTVLWIGGGLFALLLFGCFVVSALGLWIARDVTFSTPSSAASNVERGNSEIAARGLAAATPRPLVIVAPPEEGIDYENAVLANLYQQVNPSVVNVTLLGTGDSLLADVPESHVPDSFDRDGLYSISSGSGFVWDGFGHIVTNNHVVADADEVQVTFGDGKVTVAEVIGVDVDSDLAVLRIDPEGYDLLPIQRGNQEDVYVGMRVAAIGNPFGLEGTLTSGIVSAMGRSIPARTSFSIPDAIQTDAAINPGNSGGPLLNERGELIGVNAQIRGENRANSGVGFAIPVAIVERVVPELIADGDYDHSYIGISGHTVNPICSEAIEVPKTTRGALVLDVLKRTPASRAGLRASNRPIETDYPGICPPATGGDLIVAIDGQPVTTFDDVLIYLERYTSPGSEVTLTVLRSGEEIELTLTLAKRPG